MSGHNEHYLNRHIFSTPPPNYNLPSSSETWDFKSPPPNKYDKTVNDHSPSPVTNFKSNPSPSPAQSYSSEVPLPPTPSFNTASQYPLYVGTPSAGSVKVAHTPPPFPIASPISAAEQRTNLLANYLALYYSKSYDGDNSLSTFPKTNISYSTTPEPYMFHSPQYLPPLPSQPPPPPPQNPPPPPQKPPSPQNPPPPPPQTSSARSPSSASSSSQYRVPHYSPQYPHSYSKPFYNYKRKSESEDYHKKNTKKRKKPLSQNIPMRKDWSVKDAKRALDVEKESNKRSKRQSLIIKFPDLDLNRDIVSKFHPSIENVHFQQPSTPRFCFVTLKDSADPEKVISHLNKIPFGQGHLVAEFKKDREEDLNIGPEDIDPLTLYVGNLAQEVTKEDMVKCYPKQKRIDIGYAKKMKYTRYAFVSFKSVQDSIDAFKQTHASQMYSKSLIVRFRRLHGTVGMPGEPKPQASQRNDTETASIISIDSCLDEKETEPDFQPTPWDIDVSQWEVDCNMVKQEPPESPLPDEELDIKPPVSFKTKFMPGSLEVAFSLHKPKMINIKSEKLDESDDITFEQSSISHISNQNDENKNIDEQSKPEIKIEKEQDEILNKTTTYNILRSLNNKIGKNSKRTEQDQVEIKKEDVENNSPQNRLPSLDNIDEQMEHQTSVAGNKLPSRKGDVQHNNTTFIHNDRMTTQEKGGVIFNDNMSRNSDSNQLISQKQENYIESNITRSDNKTVQSSPQIIDRNITNKNSRSPVSQTVSSDSFNQNTTKQNYSDNEHSNQNAATKARPEQQKIKVSSSQISMSKDCQSRQRIYNVKKNCETSNISKEQVSRENDMKNQSGLKEDLQEQLTTSTRVPVLQNGDLIEDYSKHQVFQKKDQIIGDENKSNQGLLNDSNPFIQKQKATNCANDEHRKQLPSRSIRDVNISSNIRKVSQRGQWDSQARKESPLTRNSSQKDYVTEQIKNKFSMKGDDRIRQEITSFTNFNDTTKEHMATKSSNRSYENVSRIQKNEENQGVMEVECLIPIVGSQDLQKLKTLPSIQTVFSMNNEEYAELTSLNQNESISNPKGVRSPLKESFSGVGTRLQTQVLPADKSIFHDQEKEDFGSLLKDNPTSDLSDWMSGATEIKNEPMSEDHMNDGDKDDSSDDDFNFNNILSSMKNKMKKKRLN